LLNDNSLMLKDSLNLIERTISGRDGQCVQARATNSP